jgi:hypothetical protein
MQRNRAREARRGETDLVETTTSPQPTRVAASERARLPSPSVPKREQSKRQEQEWQKENVTRRQREHDHSNSESYREYAHSETPLHSFLVVRKRACRQRVACCQAAWFVLGGVLIAAFFHLGFPLLRLLR